jgi:histidyl-tRNA synthetase
MTKPSTKAPSGMRDFLPEDIARRNHVTDVVREVYERYGFVPLETPAIENLDVLLGNYGEEEKLIYRLLHRGETLRRALEGGRPTEADLADQALRYDLTVPLARVVARYPDLPTYFKRYQIQPVWRADRPGKGRYREFYQCDVDVIGTKSLLAEAEVCAAVSEVLDRLGFDDYVLGINHRGVLRGLIRTAEISETLEESALVAVDKLDKIGADGVRAELVQRGIEKTAAHKLLELIGSNGQEGGAVALEAIQDEMVDDDARAAVAELVELLELVAPTPAGARAVFSPRIVRGLGYYTGTIFEVTSPGLGTSLAGGGRYDGLIGVFGRRAIPAVGFSIGLERILYLMQERSMYPDLETGPQVMLCWMEVEPASVLEIAHALRSQGLRVEVFPERAKLGKQLQYADSAGVRAPFAGIVGPDELAAQEITIKHLASGRQQRVGLDLAATTVMALGASK